VNPERLLAKRQESRTQELILKKLLEDRLFEDRSPVGFSSCGIMIELFMSELFKLNNLGDVFFAFK
jgi:hypothetical protein